MSNTTRLPQHLLDLTAARDGLLVPADLIAFHRRHFGDARMETETATAATGTSAPAAGAGQGDGTNATGAGDGAAGNGTKQGGTGGDEQLGEPGLRALQNERAARAAAEQKVTGVQEKLDGLLDGLKKAIGADSGAKGGKDDPAELITGLQKQLDQLNHSALVNDVARRHSITKDDDVALLAAVKDKTVMEQIAARIKPSEETPTGTPRGGRPRPDSSQGKGGGGDAARPSSVAQVMADRAAARTAKK